MPNTVIDIDAYLDSIGLKHHRNINQFWSYIDSRYPRNQVGDLERAYMKLERGDEAAFYDEIFQSLKLSLDFASLRRDLYRSYLEFLRNSITDAPKTVVDVGCGNGILTCFYAHLYPEAKILGFDISDKGIDCARELALQLGKQNVEFVVADANDLELPIEKGSVDLITSVASLSLSGATVEGNVPAYERLSKKPKLKDMLQVGCLAPYLEPERGIFLSFDKVSNLAMQVTWANIIQRSGLGISLDRSAWLSYQNIESDTVTLPALISGPGVPKTSSDDLVSFFALKEADLSNWALDFGQESLSELVFTFINPRRFVRGARATYRDGTGIYWYELWQAGPFAILFEHTDQGFRTLRVNPSRELVHLNEEVDNWIEQTSAYADVEELSQPEIQFSGAP